MKHGNTIVLSLFWFGLVAGCSSGRGAAGAPVSSDNSPAPPLSAPAEIACLDGAACNTPAGAGMCVAGACNTCSDGVDDARCKTAYGDSYICKGSLCTQGECSVSADCGNGGLCVANRCAACTSWLDCSSEPSYGEGFFCIEGACRSLSCAVANEACKLKGRECCNLGDGTLACVTGDCCDDSQCSGSQTCQSHHCEP